MIDVSDVQNATDSNVNIPVKYKETISDIEAVITKRANMGLNSIIVTIDVLQIGKTFEEWSENTYNKAECIVNYFSVQCFKIMCTYSSTSSINLLISWDPNIACSVDYTMLRRCCEFAVKYVMDRSN